MAQVHPPLAKLSVTVNGLTITADASASTTPQGTIIQYRFSFGDGHTRIQTTPIATHTYATGGTFAVAVTVVNSAQLTRRVSHSVIIGNPPLPPPVPTPPPSPPVYQLTVVSGTGTGMYTAGTVVSIVASAPPAGDVFSAWTGAAVASATSSSTTLTMPAQAVTVTATYVPTAPPPPPTYRLTVANGTGSGTYTSGTVVAIVANAAPPSQVFSAWTGATVAVSTSPSTTLTMAASTTTVTATYVAGPPPPTPPPPVLTSVTVSGPFSGVVGSTTLQYFATAHYDSGFNQDVTVTATWHSSDPTVFTMSAQAVMTTVAAGTANVIAIYGGLTGTQSVTLAAPPPPPVQPPAIPSSPVPASMASSQATAYTLTWSASGATSQIVRFGGVNPPPPVATVTTSSYAVSGLGVGTYYWQIVPSNSAGSVQGPIWSFTVLAVPPPPAPPPPTGQLLQSGNVVQLGSFTAPVVVGPTGLYEFDYANAALGYNAANNSLFVVGHDWGQHIAEMSIPALGGTATMLQSFVDALYGQLPQIAPTATTDTFKIGGLFVSGTHLLVSGYDYYDAGTNATKSHFARTTTLSNTTVTGPMKVGILNPGFYAGYFSAIPAAWQTALGGDLLVGMNGIPIVSRTSYGPAAFAVSSASLIAGTDPTTATPLLYYDQAHQNLGQYGQMGVTNPLYNGTAKARGALIVPNTSTLLFFGSTSLGPYCYGLSTNDPTLGFTTDPATGDTLCYDPANSAKGEHGYPYSGYVWAYNLNDLAAVKAGSKNPWDVQPYASWTLPMFCDGFSYDVGSGKLYIATTGSPFTVSVWTIQ